MHIFSLQALTDADALRFWFRARKVASHHYLVSLASGCLMIKFVFEEVYPRDPALLTVHENGDC